MCKCFLAMRLCIESGTLANCAPLQARWRNIETTENFCTLQGHDVVIERWFVGEFAVASPEGVCSLKVFSFDVSGHSRSC